VDGFTAPDGLAIAADLRPGRPRAVMVHATGFCKEVWRPVVRRLPGWGVLAVDQRGHGASDEPEPPFDWWDLGRDLLAGVGAAGWEKPLGVGHSSGAAALIMAEVLAPGTFSGLVLVEPIVFPPPYGRAEDLPLAVSAEGRRAWFPSREAVLDSFRGRGPFARWTEEALEAYADGGFRDRDGGRALACRPEVEAEWYRSGHDHRAWDRLDEVACPVVVVGGEDSATHPGALLEAQAGRIPDARVEIVAGATHFVPMEAPGEIAALVETAAGR
jgi:pimeloyl-ACP methyl ester carboxylesterase